MKFGRSNARTALLSAVDAIVALNPPGVKSEELNGFGPGVGRPDKKKKHICYVRRPPVRVHRSSLSLPNISSYVVDLLPLTTTTTTSNSHGEYRTLLLFGGGRGCAVAGAICHPRQDPHVEVQAAAADTGRAARNRQYVPNAADAAGPVGKGFGGEVR